MRTHMASLAALLLGACTPTTDGPDPAGDSDTAPTDTQVWGQEALDYLSGRLGSYEGEWQLYALDASDEAQASWSWTDVATASNLRIEGDRALMDVVDVMDLGGNTQEVSFYEGVYINEDGSVGDYFVDMDDEITIMIEVEPDLWEYETALSAQDYQSMVNVTANNVIEGWKRTTKVVSQVGGMERHDISVLTHVEYEAATSTPITVEYTSLTGHHQKVE